jgi:hypothetical protein
MRILVRMLWLGWATLFVSFQLAAQDAPKIDCPKSVPLVDPQLTKPIDGWKVVFEPSPHYLSHVTFFDGPVEENASLLPDEETSHGKTRTARWLFQPGPERPYWLACYYSGTSLALSRSLSAELKECTVTYNAAIEIDGVPEIKSFSCR